MKRLPISCCYIVHNEEQFLRTSLESVVDWVSELHFLDSGSTDRTKEIATAFESRVPKWIWKEFQWKNDFSAARNEIAGFAKEAWILFLDGDEVLEDSAPSKISQALDCANDTVCFSLIQRNYTLDPGIEEGRRIDSPPREWSQKDRPFFYLDNRMERLYRSDQGLRYEGRIHESLMPTCERLHLKHSHLDLILHHYGRLKTRTPEKLKYYLELTERKWKEDPHHPASWIEWAINLMELGHHDRAFELVVQALQKFPGQSEILRIAFQSALRTGRFDVAEKWIRCFLNQKPCDLYAKSQLTTALLHQKKFDAVYSLAEEIFREDPQNFVAHLNCGVIAYEQQKWGDAARHLETALTQKPEDLFVREALKKVRSHLQKN